VLASRAVPSVCANCLCAQIGIISPFNNVASSLLLERDFFKEPPSECALEVPNQCQGGGNDPVHCPSSQFYQPPLPANISLYGSYYSEVTADDIDCTDSDWSDGCAKEFCNRLDDGILQANTIMSIPYFMAASLLPIFGGLVDKYGKRALVLFLVPILLLIVHLLMGFTDVNPIPLMIGQGIGYTAMASTLWPSFSLVVEKRYTGLGFGIAFSMQNAGLSVIPIIIATIYTSSGEKYIPNVELFFVALAAAGIVVGLWLNYDDYKHNWLLNSPLKDVVNYEPLLAEEDETVVILRDDNGDNAAAERAERVSRNRLLSEDSRTFI
jgi:MFS family permease